MDHLNRTDWLKKIRRQKYYHNKNYCFWYLYFHFFHSFLILLRHGFYFRLSIEMSIVRIINDFKVAESNNHLMALISPDLLAAFDPSDHPFLLKLFLPLASRKKCSPNILPTICSHLSLYKLSYILMLNVVVLFAQFLVLFVKYSLSVISSSLMTLNTI